MSKHSDTSSKNTNTNTASVINNIQVGTIEKENENLQTGLEVLRNNTITNPLELPILKTS